MHKTVLLSNLFIYNRKATLLSTFFTRKYNTLCRALSETRLEKIHILRLPRRYVCVLLWCGGSESAFFALMSFRVLVPCCVLLPFFLSLQEARAAVASAAALKNMFQSIFTGLR